MGITFSSVVPAPIDEVFAWHARPGAITRLTPPWQPATVRQEAESLRDGRAVLRLPGGLRWVARHDPAGYAPPERFVDELAGGPIRWRHTHEFAPVDGAFVDSPATRCTDRVDTPVPELALRSMFAYRHRQLADDLAAHARGRELRADPLTVAITGASGLVGTALAAFLTGGGHTVVRLVRHPPKRPDERRWDPERPAEELLSGVDAVVHLAGATIAARFTDGHKAAIRDSRIEPTRRLAERAAAAGVDVFVSASAVGYYGPDRGDEWLTETSRRGEGFLADVVADWEAASAPAAEAGGRVVRVRTGIVQTPAGGLLGRLYPLFFAGLGGRLATGDQWMSWIGIDDLVDVYHRALLDSELSGPVNAVTPEPVTNADYTRTLAHVLRRPAFLPLAGMGTRIVLGAEASTEFAEASQRVRPAALAARGHRYRRPGLDAALSHVLGRTREPDSAAG